MFHNGMRDGQSTPGNPAIVVENATKTFGKLAAIDGMSFSIGSGELFGFIGPDGAGKSTLFRLLAGVMAATSGKFEIFDRSPRDQRLNVGYLTQEFSLYSDLSIDENLKYFGKARGVPEEKFASRRDYLLDLTELKPFASRLAGQLSGGMKQKLSLCCIMIFSPRVLLLDEPSTGLDPISRREIWHLLAHVAAEGVTALVATPNFSEAELCDRVALLHQGKIVKSGQPNALREELELTRVQIRAANLDEVETALDRTLQKKLHSGISDINRYGDRIDLLTKSKERASLVLHDALGWDMADDVAKKNKTICTFEEATLENVFVITMRDRGFEEPEALPFPRGSGAQTSNSGAPGIVAEQLGKSFGSFQAVENVSFAIKYGEIFGLLGANGAGKTTIIKMLCGLVDPSSGIARLCGRDREQTSNELRRQIGYMSQRFTLYDDLSVLENLRYYAAAYSITGAAQKDRIEWVLSVCNLEHSARLPVKTLPQGLKQRIAFGAAVMHQPDVLFLDEPTSGVDPLVRRQMWKLTMNLAEKGTAVLVTTHFLDDAEYCHRLGLMVSGKVVAEGSPHDLRSASGRLFEIFLDDVHKAYAILSEKIDVSLLSIFPRKIHVQLGGESDNEQKVLTYLKDAGIRVERSAYVAPSLEDAFVQIVRGAERQS
jgi:ABC-2 type transport system ATP-binding protein